MQGKRNIGSVHQEWESWSSPGYCQVIHFPVPRLLNCWVSEGKQVYPLTGFSHFSRHLLPYSHCLKMFLWPNEAVSSNHKTVARAAFIACLFCTDHNHALLLLKRWNTAELLLTSPFPRWGGWCWTNQEGYELEMSWFHLWTISVLYGSDLMFFLSFLET